MQSLEFAIWEEEFLSRKTTEEGRTNTSYMLVQVNTQFTHFTAASLETHLLGAANKTISDGPTEKEEDDELDCSSLLLRLWKRYPSNCHNLKLML